MYRSAGSVAAEIRLRRTQNPASILVVEGGFDGRTYRQQTSSEIQIVVAGNDANVIESVSALEEAAFPGVLGIVDRDYRGMGAGTMPTSPNILTTDRRDLELTLVATDAWDRVVASLGSERKVRAFEGNNGPLRDHIVSQAAIIGAMRLHSARTGAALTFNGIGYRAFVDQETLRIDRRLLATAVRNKSNQPRLDIDLLLDEVLKVEGEGIDPLDISCGHDVLDLLALGLRRALGNQSASAVNGDRIGNALALAVDRSEWQGTALHGAMTSWEGRNPGYRVIRR